MLRKHKVLSCAALLGLAFCQGHLVASSIRVRLLLAR